MNLSIEYVKNFMIIVDNGQKFIFLFTQFVPFQNKS